MGKISNLQTIYAQGPTLYEKNQILLKPSSNCKIVTIKADRTCSDCGCVLKKGTRCYTLNNRMQGRTWVCFLCIPEPDVEEVREIGESFGYGVDLALAYYSREVDSLEGTKLIVSLILKNKKFLRLNVKEQLRQVCLMSTKENLHD